MKFLGIDTSAVKLLGKLTFTNNTEFPIVVSVWQTGPLYYRVLASKETWSTNCGSVWFTVKAWLYNGENNINPGIKYSLLAGNIVGFAALGALGLGATALASHHGVSLRNPDWEEWLAYNHLGNSLSDKEVIKGVSSISRCEYSRAGVYAGSHPHLFVSGGPVRRIEKGNEQRSTAEMKLQWHELRIDSCAFDNTALPLISSSPASEAISDYCAVSDISETHSHSPSQRRIISEKQSDLVDFDAQEAPELPKRHLRSQEEEEEERPAMPKRPSRARETDTGSYRYEINP